MEQALEIFKHEEFGGVRVVMVDDKAYFVGRDIAVALGYSNPNDALAKHVPDKFKLVSQIAIAGQKRNVTLINEAGLYKLVMRSKLPNAEKFSDWVCEEVLPSIRKQGMYINPNAPIDPRFLRRMADELEARDKKIAELQPKADYCEKVLQSPEALNVTVIAKDYGMSGVMFNQLLYSLKIQYRSGKTWVLYQEYMNKGYVVKETVITKNGGTATQMKWTQKGRFFLYNTLKKHGKVPLSEREEPISLFGGVA